MSKRRLVITAVLSGQSQSEVARRYGVSQGWISRLMARYQAEGEAVFEARSRRPNNNPNATPPEVVDLVIDIRRRLRRAGLDAGAETIAWHLEHTHKTVLARATINRILTRAHLVTPEPKKRPKSSYIRFEAAMPNEGAAPHWKPSSTAAGSSRRTANRTTPPPRARSNASGRPSRSGYAPK